MKRDRLFDDLARTLAGPLPRRQALGRILGGLAGVTLAMIFGTGEARADPKPKAGKCPPNHKACPATGTPVTCCPRPKACCGAVCCQPNERCVEGVCKREGSPSNTRITGR